MSGGARHWNEDTQRWETGTAPASAPTPPPPARPDPDSRAPSAVQWDDTGWRRPEQPAAAPGRGPDRRLVWSAVVGAAVAGVTVSLVLTFVVGQDDGRDEGNGAGASTTASSTPPDTVTGTTGTPGTRTPSPYPTPTPTPSSLSAPPAGFSVRDDDEGFRIAVPDTWTRSSVASQYGMAVVNYRSPDSERRLQIYQVSEASPRASFDTFLSAKTTKPDGFRKLDLRVVAGGGYLLEYLADRIKGEPDVGTWHMADQRFYGADAKVYDITSYGPDSDGRDDELRYLTVASHWFCPPDTTCDTVAAPQ
ncbi:hypothetical protein ACIO13_32470 [Streptomyces sp. NPDC087425]|uniref:hypothetical protein n=1 Tax=Streptomyces sp. NPDC087425 TaxID=3365787 RepID=UPI003816A785